MLSKVDPGSIKLAGLVGTTHQCSEIAVAHGKIRQHLTSSVLLATGIVSTQNRRLAARWPTKLLLVGGFALYAVGFLGIALAGSILILVDALIVVGAGSGLVTPTLFAMLSSLAPDHVRGGVMSLQTTTNRCQSMGPALFTLLGGAVGYQATLLSASGGAVLGTVLLGNASGRVLTPVSTRQ